MSDLRQSRIRPSSLWLRTQHSQRRPLPRFCRHPSIRCYYCGYEESFRCGGQEEETLKISLTGYPPPYRWHKHWRNVYNMLVRRLN